jgi:hypothetical protein
MTHRYFRNDVKTSPFAMLMSEGAAQWSSTLPIFKLHSVIIIIIYVKKLISLNTLFFLTPIVTADSRF